MKIFIYAPFVPPRFITLTHRVSAPLRDLLPEGVVLRDCRINDVFCRDWHDRMVGGDDCVELYMDPGSIAIGGALVASITLSATTIAVGAFILKAALLIGLSLAVQALTPKPRLGGLSLGGASGRREEAFGIAGLTNTVVAGTPKFVVYGTRRIFGHLIATDTNVSPDGKNMSFSALYFMGDAGGDGYQSIADVEVNGIAASDIPGVTTDARLGLPLQSVIDGFEEISQAYSDGRELALNVGLIYALKSATAKRVKIIILYSSLRSVAENGGDRPGESHLTVEFKPSASPDWILAVQTRFRQQSLTKLFKEIDFNFGASDEWEIRVTETFDKNANDFPRAASPNGVLFNVVEIEESTHSYPNNAILAVRGAGSEQVQSLQGMEVSALVQGKQVKVFDGVAHTMAWSDKRAWIIRDMLTHPQVGLGHRIPEVLFDDAAALVAQNYWDEMVEGFEGDEPERRDICDVLINDRRPGWDWIKDILADARGIMIPSEGKFKIAVDRPQSPNLPWSSPGNIIDESLRNEVGTDEKSINTVRAEFPDMAKDYKNNVIELQDSGIGSDPVKDASFTFLSVVRESQAQRALQYHLKRRVLVRRRWQWTATQSAQVSEPLDVDYLSYETFGNKRGWSGFVKHIGSDAELFLDAIVELEAGKAYDAIVRNQDNITQKVLITTAAGKVGKVDLVSPLDPLAQIGDIWVIGEQGVQVETVRIESVKPKGDGTVEVTAAEYQAAVYTQDPLPPPTDRRFFRNSAVPPLPLADARVAESVLINSDGSFASKLLLAVTPGVVRWGGTVQESTPTDIVFDGNFPPISGHFNSAEITIAGVTQVISAYDGALRKATVPAAWSPLPVGLGRSVVNSAGFSVVEVDNEDPSHPAANAIDGLSGTKWETAPAAPSSVVWRVGPVLTGFMHDAVALSFTVPVTANALIIVVYREEPSTVVWDRAGSQQVCERIGGNALMNVWRLVAPNLGALDLEIRGILGQVGVAVWALSGVNPADMFKIEKVQIEGELSGVTSSSLTLTYEAGEFGLLMVGGDQVSDADAGGVMVQQFQLVQAGVGADFGSGVLQEVFQEFDSISTAPWIAVHVRMKGVPAVDVASHPHHLTIDMGATKVLVAVGIDSVAGGHRIRGARVFVAPDVSGAPGAFEEVYAGILQDVASQDIRVPRTVGRFVKIQSLDSHDEGQQASVTDVRVYEEGVTPSPSLFDVRFTRFEATEGFLVETSPDAQSPWAFLVEVIGTSHEIQASRGGVLHFRFTPRSIFNSKNFTGRIVRPMLLVGDQSAPLPPTNVTAIGSVQSAVVSWVPSTAEDLESTDVYRSPWDDNATATRIASAAGGYFSDVNLNAPQAYYYWLKSRDTSGNQSAFHAMAGVQAITTTGSTDTEPPAVPTGLTLTPSGTLANDGTFTAEIVVSFDANTEPDLMGYHVEWRRVGASEFTLFFSRANSTAIVGVLPAVSYEARVRAVDVANNVSQFTAFVSVTTTADPGAPSVPSGLTATGFPLSIGLFWNLNTEQDINGYELQRANNAAFTAGVVSLTTSLSLSYMDNLGGGIQKWYRLRAIRRTGVPSGFTTIVTATTNQLGSTDLGDVIIGAAHIQSAAITTAMIQTAAIKTALIDDLQVNTIKIANNAVTNSGQSFVSNAGIVGDAVWESHAFVGVNSQGGSILVLATYEISSTISVVRVRLTRNGVPLAGNLNDNSFIFDIDHPGAGFWTYNLEFFKVETGEIATISNVKFSFIETLR